MSDIFSSLRPLALCLLAMPLATAAKPGWETRLAQHYSPRWQEIQNELKTLTHELKSLPDAPIDDQGGTGGFASFYKNETDLEIDVRWKTPAMVDLVVLIPARRYDAKGLDACYGLPLAFTIDLLDAEGRAVQRIGQEIHTDMQAIRKGFPFYYKLPQPILAVGLRITAQELDPKYENEGARVQAWAEAMAFSGDKNLALSVSAVTHHGVAPLAPWQWSPAFLVDGQTPLGLPEVVTAPIRNVGWISEARSRADEATSLQIDLGDTKTFDTLRLIPARMPTSDQLFGFGFPKKITIATSTSGQPESWSPLALHDMSNPGHNPVALALEPTKARYIKVTASQLWKAFDDYPAFFALSEIEVLHEGTNLALHQNIQSPGTMMISSGDKYWNTVALSDGNGPVGQLIPIRQWLNLLNQRSEAEMKCFRLRAEAAQLVESWSYAVQTTSAILALLGILVTIALPIRYRLMARKELTQIRERIAGDLHDEVGSNLGSIQMIADLAEGRSGPTGPTGELKRIQRIAAETVSAVRDIVWLLRPSGDHRISTVEHLRETSSIMLESLQWKFSANEEAWQVELAEAANRDLFLFYREALHNILRHSKAEKVHIHVEKSAKQLHIQIDDNGVGIDSTRLERNSTLRALKQRAAALFAEFKVETEPERGTHIGLSVPLSSPKRAFFSKKLGAFRRQDL